jgi:hypothetical protein
MVDENAKTRTRSRRHLGPSSKKHKDPKPSPGPRSASRQDVCVSLDVHVGRASGGGRENRRGIDDGG